MEVHGAVFDSTGYYREGFLSIQRALDKSILEALHGTTMADDIPLKTQRHPYPPFIYDPYVYVLQNNFPSLILLSFLIMAPNVVKDLVLEKERKLRVRETLFVVKKLTYIL